MKWRRAVWLVLGVVIAGWWIAGLSESSVVGTSALDSLAARELDVLDRDIAFFTERTRRDPESAFDRSSLAARYLQRARETGSEEDNRRAEEAARQSLALRLVHNVPTYALLASSLLAQHRFTEALRAAHELVRADSTALASLALLGEVYLELGRYDSAGAIFGRLRVRRDLAVAPRVARWDELSGRLDEAERTFADAIQQLPRQSNLRSEQVAWFYLRRGELELKQGRLGYAERTLRSGLAVRPGDHRLLAGLAKLELMRGRPRRAIEYGEHALASQSDPATLGIVAGAYYRLGDSARAEEYSRAMEVAVGGQSGPFHRAWSLFLLNHDRRVPEVLANAEREIRTRRDVYGYDLLAWALYKQQRYLESAQAMTAALALGTEDAMLYYHAGMIERGLGDAASARGYFERARALNPRSVFPIP